MKERISTLRTLLKKCRWDIERESKHYTLEQVEEKKILKHMKLQQIDLENLQKQIANNFKPGARIEIDALAQMSSYQQSVIERIAATEEYLLQQQQKMLTIKSSLIECKNREQSIENKHNELINEYELVMEKKQSVELDELAVSYRSSILG